MTDNVVEQRGLPVNEQGSIVASHSLDNRTVVGARLLISGVKTI